MLTVTQFAKKRGISRARVHQLIAKNRIEPRPELVGNVYILDGNARIKRPLTNGK